jgi:hypothetical protein
MHMVMVNINFLLNGHMYVVLKQETKSETDRHDHV